MKTNLAAWLAVVVVSTLSGCVNMPPVQSNQSKPGLPGQNNTAECTPIVEKVMPPPGVKSEADLLIDYYLSMRKQPKEKVLKEQADAIKAVQTTPTAFNRVKLALLSNLPITGVQDSQRALNLLQETLKDETQDDVALRNLAALLQAQFYKEVRQEESLQRSRDDQKRLESLTAKQDDAIQAMTLKLKEEQKRYDTLQTSIQTKQDDSNQTTVILSQRLKEEQKRADILQQKLDALTNIEKTIIDRQQQVKPEVKPEAKPEPKK